MFEGVAGGPADKSADDLPRRGHIAVRTAVQNGVLNHAIGDKHPIPVEVNPDSWQLVQTALQQAGGHGELRMNAAGDNVFFTAAGSLVLDMQFSDISVKTLDRLLSSLPGVVEHGIFYQLASDVLIGRAEGVEGSGEFGKSKAETVLEELKK